MKTLAGVSITLELKKPSVIPGKLNFREGTPAVKRRLSAVIFAKDGRAAFFLMALRQRHFFM